MHVLSWCFYIVKFIFNAEGSKIIHIYSPIFDLVRSAHVYPIKLNKDAKSCWAFTLSKMHL